MPATSAALFFASTVGRGQYNWVRVDARGTFARVHRWGHLPPASMPLTAASDTVRSTAFRPSLTVSVADFWQAMAVEKRRGDGRAAADRRATFDL
jgi:hypothetical protein